MTREDIQDLLAMMQATYPNYNPQDKTAAVDAWMIALDGCSADDAAAAFIAYMRTDTSGFAPPPGKLVELIHTFTHPPELGEMEAWAMVSRAIRNSGYNSVEEFNKLPPLAQKAVGLPGQLHTWAMDGDYNESVAQSHFLRCYRAEAARQREIKMMPGEVKRLIEDTLKKAIGGDG